MLKKKVHVMTQRPRGLRIVGQFGGAGVQRPILHEDSLLLATLQNDISGVLERLGYNVTEQEAVSDTLIMADFRNIHVGSSTKHWYDAKGKTEASVSILLELINATRDVRTAKEYEGYSSLDVYYVYLSDSEEVLNSAYCDALHNFAIDVQANGITG